MVTAGASERLAAITPIANGVPAQSSWYWGFGSRPLTIWLAAVTGWPDTRERCSARILPIGALPRDAWR